MLARAVGRGRETSQRCVRSKGRYGGYGLIDQRGIGGMSVARQKNDEKR